MKGSEIRKWTQNNHVDCVGQYVAPAMSQSIVPPIAIPAPTAHNRQSTRARLAPSQHGPVQMNKTISPWTQALPALLIGPITYLIVAVILILRRQFS